MDVVLVSEKKGVGSVLNLGRNHIERLIEDVFILVHQHADVFGGRSDPEPTGHKEKRLHCMDLRYGLYGHLNNGVH